MVNKNGHGPSWSLQSMGEEEQIYFCLCDYLIKNYKRISTCGKSLQGRTDNILYLADSTSEMGGIMT